MLCWLSILLFQLYKFMRAFNLLVAETFGIQTLEFANCLACSFSPSPGTEAMYADLGHFTALSIRVSL